MGKEVEGGEMKAYAKHLKVRCIVCGKEKRADKVSLNGVCASCIGEAILKQAGASYMQVVLKKARERLEDEEEEEEE